MESQRSHSTSCTHNTRIHENLHSSSSSFMMLSLGPHQVVIADAIRAASVEIRLENGDRYKPAREAAANAIAQLLEKHRLSCEKLIAATKNMQLAEIGDSVECLFAWIEFQNIVREMAEGKHKSVCNPQKPT
ncbi:unnamed protein product [Amoebophrya sp. A25]|nr:unnamed protein product [Amoebophrya sp. A25]|eukprot:GSA25T00004697001.1